MLCNITISAWILQYNCVVTVTERFWFYSIVSFEAAVCIGLYYIEYFVPSFGMKADMYSLSACTGQVMGGNVPSSAFIGKYLLVTQEGA